MKFGNFKQIVIMTLVWALALIFYDRAFNKHLFAPTAEAMKEFTQPQIRLWVNHLCCSGCMDSAFQATRDFSWLGKPQMLESGRLLTMEQANTTQSRTSYGKGVMLDVLDLSKVEFVRLLESLREKGLVAGSVEFGGIPRYSLKIGVGKHLCCHLCVKALEEAMVPKQDPKYGTTLQWLEGAKVSQVTKSVTAFVRIGYAADISELISTMDNAGFPAEYIRVQVEMKDDLVYPPN